MMRTYWKHRGTTRTFALACVLAGGVVAACDHSSPTNPEPPGVARRYVMNYDVFVNTVDPILSAQGCDNLNCHGGGNRGTFDLSPYNDKDPGFDYTQASLQVFPGDPVRSPLIMKALAEECGGATHGGGAFFFSLDDPDYVAILTWIENGEFE